MTMKSHSIITCLIVAGLFLCTESVAQNFNISLNVNDVKEDTVYLDEPVLFMISLSNQFAEYNLRNNREAQFYLDELKLQSDKGEISKEYFESETARVKASMKEVKAVKVGSETKPWAKQVEFVLVKSGSDTLGIQPALFQYPESEPVSVLNESSYVQSAYGLENKLGAGEYNITVRLQGTTSHIVHLTVLPQKIPTDVLNSEAMLLHFGNYYGSLADEKKALEYASKAIAQFPNSVKAFLMRGDIYLRQSKWKEALSDYETSLRLFYERYPDSYEAPEYTLQMIEFVKSKM